MASCESNWSPAHKTCLCWHWLSLLHPCLQAVEAEGLKGTRQVTIKTLHLFFPLPLFSFILPQLCQWNKHSIYSTQTMILREYLEAVFCYRIITNTTYSVKPHSIKELKGPSRWLMGINWAPHRENKISGLRTCIRHYRGQGGGPGKTAAHSEGQGPTTGPVLGTARFIPIAHNMDFRYIPNRSDKTQNHRSKHWLSSAVGTQTFV